jgi:subtilisin family serine protease/outer membrane protein assembly factor BamB
MRARFTLAALLAIVIVLAMVRFKFDDGIAANDFPQPVTAGLQALGVPVTLPVVITPDANRPRQTPRTPWVDHQLLVRVKPGITLDLLEKVAARFEAKVIESFPNTPGLFLLSLPKSITVPFAADLIGKQPEIAHAAANVLYYTSTVPNDSHFVALWGLHDSSSTDPADPDIDAAEYWDHFTGNDRAVIGVIDTGVDYLHSDLAPNMWVNPNEIDGNGIDDDNNGYVDDVHGIDAIILTGNPIDSHFHGTHVAGTIGAVGNNGFGVAGVAWTARIAACKFLDSNGAGSDAGAVRCLDYFTALKARGVNIVATNNSWGANQQSTILRDAIARHQTAGILFVAAAGNEAANNDQKPVYPASFDLPNIISVGAIDQQGNRAWFSNYGATSVDLFAPGVGILSTYPGTLLSEQSGTSMAAPHVTGMIGLLAADDPTATPTQLTRHVLDNAIRLPTHTGLSQTGGIAHLKLPPSDRDADGMDDRWERRFGLNPANPADAAEDTDGDGLTNLREFQLGTYPTTRDTDADAIWDGREVNEVGTNPLLADTDGDGLADGRELEVSTRPTQADTDGDGLSDGTEVNNGRSDPLRADTDGDGMNDGFEERHNLDPRNSADATLDSDSDGLDNRTEAANGTNPRARDSDFDDLTDIDELQRHGTSPIRADTDGDGMLDGWEILYSFNSLSAADALLDADGDGASNLAEYRAGSDPRDANSTPPNQPWSGFRGNAARTGHVPITTAAVVKDQRWFKAKNDGGVDHFPTIGTGHLFAARSHGGEQAIVALSLLDGTQAWEHRPPQSFSALQPVMVNGNVVTAFRNHLQSYTLTSLTPQGRVNFSERFSTGETGAGNEHLMSAGNRVFLSAGNLIIAFDAVSGRELWRMPIASTGAIQPGWLAAAGRNHVGVFVGQTLYLLDQVSGQEARRITFSGCGSAHDASVLFDAADIPYVFMNGCLASFNVASATIRWSRTDLAGFSQPSMAGSRIFASQPYGPVVALDSNTGNILWSRETDQSIEGDLVSSSTHVFVPTNSETFALNVADGSLAWRLPFTGQIALSDDGVFTLFTSIGLRVLNLDDDRDGDGIPDWWERTYQLSSTRATDAAQDFDGDGVSNLEEFRQRSHPRVRDTDEDGLGDGEERANGSNPRERDTDGDSIPDGQEVTEYRTNPTLKDTDGDAVDDAEEIQRYRTDPTSASSRPDLVYREHISFETELPANWRLPVPSEPGWQRSSSRASDGSWALEAVFEPGAARPVVEWNANFSKGELVFDFFAPNEQSSLYITRNQGQYLGEVNTRTSGWQTYRIAVPENTSNIQFEAGGGFGQTSRTTMGFIDNVYFRKPAPLGSDPNNLVLLSRGQLHEFTIEGRSVRAPVKLESEAAGLGSYIAATVKHEIAILSFRGWSFYDPLNDRIRDVNERSFGSGAPPVATPFSLLSRWGDGRIARFDLEGRFLNIVGEPNTVVYLAYGKDEFVYTIDMTATVRKYGADRMELVSIVNLDNMQYGPIAVDEEGRIYLQNGNGKYLFQPDGTPVRQLEINEAQFINGVLLDRLNQLVTNRRTGELRIADPELTSIRDVKLDNGLDQESFGHLAVLLPEGPDTDLDGCPDWWEITHGFLQFQPADGDSDADADGLANRFEFSQGSNPRVADTDGDGLNDREESEYGSDPTVPDSDLDGLSDREERTLQTSSRRTDTDNDGINDYVEARIRGTRPNDSDSDDDGMPDGWEVSRRLDPLNAVDGLADPDADGLNNKDEYANGTEINLADSDADTLSDANEVRRGTRPNHRDSDDDLLDDGFEVNFGFNPLRAGEARLDADNDGFSNIIEARFGSDPRSASLRPSVPGWTGYLGDARHRGFSPVRVDISRLARRWSVNVTGGVESPVSPVSVAHGRLHVTSDLGSEAPFLASLNAQTGAVIWRRELQNESHPVSGPAESGNRIIVHGSTAGIGGVQVYDRTTGNTLSSTATGRTRGVLPAPAVRGGIIAALDAESGGISGLDLANGVSRWSRSFSNFGWWVPALEQDRLLVFNKTRVSAPFRLSVLNAATGDLHYSISAPIGITAVPGIAVAGFRDDVFATTGNDLYRFNLLTRRLHWKSPGYFDAHAPVIGNGEIYTNELRTVVAIDEQLGQRLWTWIAPEYLIYPLVATASHIFASSDTTLYAIDIATRQTVWTAPTPGHISIGDNRLIYVAGRTGNITAYAWFSDLDSDGSPDEEDLDRDGDGMLNDWETRYGFNPLNAADGLQDADNDGLQNFREHGLRTLPRNADTDGDGINDFLEVRQGYDPVDASCRSLECTLIRNGLNLPVIERAAKQR